MDSLFKGVIIGEIVAFTVSALLIIAHANNIF